MNKRLARVAASVPIERVDLTLGDGSVPQVGDIGEVDHMYTSESGKRMLIVYCTGPDGRLKWAADLLDAEIEPLSNDGVI
jgi:hypothetical protein